MFLSSIFMGGQISRENLIRGVGLGPNSLILSYTNFLQAKPICSSLLSVGCVAAFDVPVIFRIARLINRRLSQDLYLDETV